MEIKTKFSIGDKVWTISNCKATCIEINCIICEVGGVSYASSRYGQAIPENLCFNTKSELLEYISDDDNGNQNL